MQEQEYRSLQQVSQSESKTIALEKLRFQLQLELRSLKTKGHLTAYAALRQHYGMRGCRKEMLDQLNKMIGNQDA